MKSSKRVLSSKASLQLHLPAHTLMSTILMYSKLETMEMLNRADAFVRFQKCIKPYAWKRVRTDNAFPPPSADTATPEPHQELNVSKAPGGGMPRPFSRYHPSG